MIGSLTIGGIIEGRYELRTQRVDEGPYAVFEGIDRRTGAMVEARTLTRACDEDMRLRFGRYAQAVARLDHPGCVRAHCAGSTPEGLLYVVLDDVAPARLSRRLGTPLEPHHIADIGAQLLRALEHAIGQGVVTGPLRLEDIEERIEGARIVVRIVELAGTPPSASDPTILATAGRLVRELVAGCDPRLLSEDSRPLPFRSSAPTEILDRHLERLWSDDPKRRFESASAAAEALEQWCRDNAAPSLGLPPLLPEGGVPRASAPVFTIPDARMRRLQPRRSVLPVVLGVAALATAAVVAFVAMQPRPTTGVQQVQAPVQAAAVAAPPLAEPLSAEQPPRRERSAADAAPEASIVADAPPAAEERTPPRKRSQRKHADTRSSTTTRGSSKPASSPPGPEHELPPKPPPKKADEPRPASVAKPLQDDIKSVNF